MKIKTIKQLNQINTDFYNSIAKEFSESRNYPWQGWERCLPHIKNIISNRSSSNKTLKVADIGCGNGRFGLFLAKNISSDFEYTGVDNNKALLDTAKNSLKNLSSDKKSQDDMRATKTDFIDLDLIESLISKDKNDQFLSYFDQNKYDLITVFGVMHHIPSLKLRTEFISQLSKLLTPNGVLIITFWQFMKDERFLYKQVESNKVNIDENDLEENDFILDWKRGKLAYRYFHHSNKEEQLQIINNLPSLKILESFNSDGKSQDLNKYYVLTRDNLLK